MTQFDLHRLGGGQLVVDLQPDLIDIHASRIVAPLRDAGRHRVLPGLTPVIEIEGAAWIVRVQEPAAGPEAEMGAPVGSFAAHRELKRGLDILIDGV
jgi:toxin CcdB